MSKFTTTPTDAVRLVCMAHDVNGNALDALVKLTELVAVSAYKQALEFCVCEYRKRHSGFCYVLSKGEDCGCFLCAVQKQAETAEKGGS